MDDRIKAEISNAISKISGILPVKGSETTSGPEVVFSREISNIGLDHLNYNIDYAEMVARLDDRLSEAKKHYAENLPFLEWAENLVNIVKYLNHDPKP